MTQKIINIGSAINDGTGDPARTAFDKSNQNFTELYAGVAANVPTGNTIEYQFNNTITEPPASGQIRFNQATQASTTKIWASHTTASGINIKQFLSAATTGAKLILQDKNDNTNYVKFDVTGTPVDKTTYWEFAVAVTASGGNLPNAAILAAVTAGGGGSGGTGFTASSTAPVAPKAGDHWYDLTTGILAIFVNDGNSSQWVQTSPGAGSGSVAAPQCGRLTFVSATQLAFRPFNGDLIKIGGVLYQIPPAGFSGLQNTSVFVNGVAGNLAASTIYYVYAFSASGVIWGDFCTAAHVTSATAGNAGTEIKSNDDSRTLIGVCRTNASAQFQDTAAYRGVISWFNRRNIGLQGSNSGGTAVTSTTPIDLTGNVYVNFLTWGDETVLASVTGYAQLNSADQLVLTQLGVDSVPVFGVRSSIASVSQAAAVGFSQPVSPTEGFHYLNVHAAVTFGTGNWYVQCSGIIRG